MYTGRDDELGQMELTIKALQAEIRTILSRIGESSEQLSTIANGNGKVVEATNQAVKQQQSGIEEVSTAMHEMAVTVDEVSGNTRRSAEAAQSADKEVEEGRQVVSETAATIQNLSEQIEHASDVIKQLDDESKAIGSVIDVINELAFQTNLLALNAAIEAARAGQHGNGFAVVAAEVRSLASRTKDSTEIIQNSVHQLQTSTKEAVDIMALGRDKAQASVMQADRAGQSLASIGEAVETIRTMTVQIASALDEQGTVAAAMDRNIADIRESAEETASTSSSMAETSVRLATQVENMKAMVLQFSETGS
ncbi:Methyl-accepting chemotaxis protein [gamma proteobacterium IMCC2047]|nr:Methyl-accepting chemotaxis protein [gamma proteobacterium IMCC2047]